MCRLFVFARADNVSSDPEIDAQKFKRGHVVEVLEDGRHGGVEAETSGLFEIIELPGEPAAKYRYLLSGDPRPDPGEAQATYPRWRINVLDLDALRTSPDPVKTLADHVSVAARMPLANVIGDDHRIIG
jgi:hypothetical protein